MSTITPSKARLVHHTSLATSFRVHHSPRRVLQSRQDNVGVLINLHLEVHFLLGKWKDIQNFHDLTTCPKLKNSRKIKSSVTNRTYEVINHTDEHFNGHAQNLVPLLTCNFCSTQYARETASQFSIRKNCHRTAMNEVIIFVIRS